MKNTLLVLMYVLLSSVVVFADTSVTTDTRMAVSAGFTLPDFSRSGMIYNIHADMPIITYLHVVSEVAFGSWTKSTAASESLDESGDNTQYWKHDQSMDMQYVGLTLRGYPIGRWALRMSPYLFGGGGVFSSSYKDTFVFRGIYNQAFEWDSKGYSTDSAILPYYQFGLGVDMPLDRTWAFVVETKWMNLPGKIGQENYPATDGLGTWGTIGLRDYSNIWLQLPVSFYLEVRPW